MFCFISGNLSQNSIQKVGSQSAKGDKDKKKKKGKKKKKKKSAKPKLPPKVGPWLNVLHAVNIGMDSMGSTGEDDDLLYDCLTLIGR